MRFALDTGAYITWARGDLKLREAVAHAEAIHVSATVLGELRAGFLVGSRERHNEEIWGRFLTSPRVRVDPIDAETSFQYASIYAYLRKNKTPMRTSHIWIAASAIQRGVGLLTFDTAFDKIPHLPRMIV